MASSGTVEDAAAANVVYTVVPHDPVVLSEIRTLDIWLLLAVGALWELVCRFVLLSKKMKPNSLLRKEAALSELQRKTDSMRKKGPSAFVETSKLERKLLASEKELSEIYSSRKKVAETVEKKLVKYGRYVIAALVFAVYYGVPIVTLDSVEIGPFDYLHGSTYMKTLLFPISVFGFGNRISKWGIHPTDVAASSIGALVVMWSSQVTVGMVMDAIESYMLCY